MKLIANYKQQYEGVYRGAVKEHLVDETLNHYSISNETYRTWLIETGGGPIGSDWYDGLNELDKSQNKLKTEAWKITGFVIGWDGSGNPIVLQKNGEILTEDHNSNGVHKVAISFEQLLVANVSS